MASAKGSYDAQKGEVLQMAAKTVFLDRVLEVYCPETTEIRKQLRPAVEDTIVQLWSGSREPAIAGGEALYTSIQKLEPQNEMQRTLKTSTAGDDRS